MLKLNSKLEKTLKIVSPYNCRPNLKASIKSSNANMHGLSFVELGIYLEELKDMGLVTIDIDEEARDLTVMLSSDAASYSKDMLLERVKTAARYAFQLLVGASGGVVVIAIEHLLFA